MRISEKMRERETKVEKSKKKIFSCNIPFIVIFIKKQPLPQPLVQPNIEIEIIFIKQKGSKAGGTANYTACDIQPQ